LENVIIKFVADTSGLKPAIDQLQLLGKISEADAASFAKINDEQKEFIQNLNKSTTEFGKLNSEVEGLMAEIQAGVMEGFADHLAEVTAETKKAGTGFKSMKAELRELKAQISSGSLGEKELREATKRAAELQDTIGDVNDKVKALASDTKRIDAVVTAFRGIAAAASVAAGAAALFGNENEKLTKTLAQAQGAMALLQGVQELANIATTEGALRTMVLDGAQKAAAVSSRILGVTITASMAMATAGVTLLLGVIAGLVISMKDAEEEGSKIIATLKDREKAVGETALSVIEQRIKRKKDGIDKELELETFYDSEIRAKNRDRLRKREIDDNTFNLLMQNQEEQHQYNLNKIKEKYAKEAIDKKKASDAELLKADQASIREQIAGWQLMINATTSVDEKIKYHQKITQLLQDQLRTNKALGDNELILEIDKLNDLQRVYEESFNKRDESDLQSYTETQEAKLEVTLDWWEKYFEVEDRFNAELAKKRKEDAQMWTAFAIDQARVVSDTVFTINQNRRNAETENLLNSLNEQREAELSNKNLTDAQRLQIEKRYQEQERRLKQQAFEADRAAAIAQAIINGALAVSKTLAVYGWTPAAAPGIIAASVATAAQIAIIQSTPIPQFADGTEFLVGKGTGRSDSNLAYLSHGERVVPAGINSDYFPALSAIHNRDVEPTFANNILTALANGTFDLAAQFQGKQQQADQSFDYDKLGKVLARNKSSVNIQMDEAGYTKYLIKENSKVQFRNTKLRLKN
jgi:hypothetical protein